MLLAPNTFEDSMEICPDSGPRIKHPVEAGADSGHHAAVYTLRSDGNGELQASCILYGPPPLLQLPSAAIPIKHMAGGQQGSQKKATPRNVLK